MSKEERAAHQKLAVKLKEMITAQPTKYHYTRVGRIFTVDKYFRYLYLYDLSVEATLYACKIVDLC